MSKIKCSILIPAYNAAEHIADSLESIAAHQSKHEFEILVIDDGSCDETAAIVSERFPSVRLIKKENGGPGSARNLGAREARSDILVFNDADDLMLEGRLDHQVDYLLANPEVKMCFGSHVHGFPDEPNYNIEQGWADSDDFKIIDRAYQRLLLKGSSVANTATAVRKKEYLEIGGQPEDYFVGEDYAMCCALALRWPIAASCRVLTEICEAREGNLMASAHTYQGPPRVLRANLRSAEELLTSEEFAAVRARFLHQILMLVRHEWMYRGRCEALEALRLYEDVLSPSFVRKWTLLTLIPSAFPKMMRAIKHRGSLPHAYE